MSEAPPNGSIAWVDLTVEDAGSVRDFYKEVVGWEVQGCDMDGGAYQDYNMMPAGTEQPVAVKPAPPGSLGQYARRIGKAVMSHGDLNPPPRDAAGR